MTDPVSMTPAKWAEFCTRMPQLIASEGVWEGWYRYYDAATGALVDQHRSRLICRMMPEDSPFPYYQTNQYFWENGRTGLVNLPLNHELSDRQILTVQQQSVDSYAEQIGDAYNWLAAEAATGGGRLLPLHLTPYIAGLPYRIDNVAALLNALAARLGNWFATGTNLFAAI